MIVLSDRRAHLENLGKMLSTHGIECGYYFGGMKQEDLKISETKQVILGTFCMVSEGFDCKSLDTLVIASPKSDVVQSVGRILREEVAKRRHTPLVIDVIDQFSIFERQANKRVQYYKKQKYNISGLEEQVSNNKLIELTSPCIVDLD
jgi:superfamily II DNA or RNA helicase